MVRHPSVCCPLSPGLPLRPAPKPAYRRLREHGRDRQQRTGRLSLRGAVCGPLPAPRSGRNAADAATAATGTARLGGCAWQRTARRMPGRPPTRLFCARPASPVYSPGRPACHGRGCGGTPPRRPRPLLGTHRSRPGITANRDRAPPRHRAGHHGARALPAGSTRAAAPHGTRTRYTAPAGVLYPGPAGLLAGGSGSIPKAATRALPLNGGKPAVAANPDVPLIGQLRPLRPLRAVRGWILT